MVFGAFRNKKTIFTAFFACCIGMTLGYSSISLAKPGKGSEGIREHKGKPGSRSGLIKANRHSINLERCATRDDFSMKIKLPRSLKAFWGNEAEAHLTVVIPANDIESHSLFQSWNIRDLVGNIDETDAEKERPVFKLGCDFLQTVPTGNYQFAIILTYPDGNPAELGDWFNAFNGLVATSRIKINAGLDEEDSDGDGEIDGDSNLDGMLDETEELVNDEESAETEETELDEDPDEL